LSLLESGAMAELVIGVCSIGPMPQQNMGAEVSNAGMHMYLFLHRAKFLR
jgi:hypothetical protein